MAWDEAVNLLQPQFPPFSRGKNNDTCHDRVVAKNGGDHLHPEFISELAAGAGGFVFGVVSTRVGGQDLGLPWPLIRSHLRLSPEGMATSHQRFWMWVWWTPPRPLQSGQDVIHAWAGGHHPWH